MTEARLAPYAATVLRIALGGLFLTHAALKIVVFTPAGTAHFFESVGVPGFVAYLTIAGELAGGLALIDGVLTRTASLALIPILLGAIVTVHGHNGFFFNNPNGGWEYPAFWIVALVVQAMLGAGAFSLAAAMAGSGRRTAVAAQ